MQYNVLGLMSGSSLDGLDMAYVQLEENAGNWRFDIRESACIPYPENWRKALSSLSSLGAREYLLLHTAYGRWMGECVNAFLEEKALAFRIQLIASHGHTAFHMPAEHMTAQLGDGAALAAVTGIRTITDLRSSDIALGGQGAPVVPIGEKLLFPDYDLFLNIGGITNISANTAAFVGFDICPANRILNMLAAGTPKGYDENGSLASSGRIEENLLTRLNALPYYSRPYPKSLANEFGLQEVYPMIAQANLSMPDALATYTEHIAMQVSKSLIQLKELFPAKEILRLLITGGGAHNLFLVERIQDEVELAGIECIVPPENWVDYKEALVMALMGVLRWREEDNVMSSVTGASRDSINGAIWSA